MAVDTRDKRMSMIGIGQPVPSLLPNPDGTIGEADRAMLLFLYHGLSLAVVVAAATTVAGTVRGVRSAGTVSS